MSTDNSQLYSEESPRCDIEFDFLTMLSHEVRESKLSRVLIIDRMNTAIGGEAAVSEGTFNKWLAKGSIDRNIPMVYLPALCWALRSVGPVDFLLKPIHFKTIDQKGQTIQLAAQMQLEAKKLNEQAEAMLAEVSQEITQ